MERCMSFCASLRDGNRTIQYGDYKHPRLVNEIEQTEANGSNLPHCYSLPL